MVLKWLWSSTINCSPPFQSSIIFVTWFHDSPLFHDVFRSSTDLDCWKWVQNWAPWREKAVSGIEWKHLLKTVSMAWSISWLPKQLNQTCWGVDRAHISTPGTAGYKVLPLQTQRWDLHPEGNPVPILIPERREPWPFINITVEMWIEHAL